MVEQTLAGKVSFCRGARVVLRSMQRAFGAFPRRRLFGCAVCPFLLLGSGWSAATLVPPTLFCALGATLGRGFLASIELCLLLRRQDGANLRALLGAEGLTALHHLPSLLHVAAEGRGVAALTSSSCRFHERLGAIA